MSKLFPRPPYDPALVRKFDSRPSSPVLGDDTLPLVRSRFEGASAIEDALHEFDIVHEERTIEGPNGEIILSI